MRILWLALFGVALALAPADTAAAAEKAKGSFVSPPLSINPNDGQPLCLASNLSPTETVTVTLEIMLVAHRRVGSAEIHRAVADLRLAGAGADGLVVEHRGAGGFRGLGPILDSRGSFAGLCGELAGRAPALLVL